MTAAPKMLQKLTRRSAIGLFAAIPLVTMGSMALADGSTVTVGLGDTGETAMDMMGEVMPMGMAMPGADMSMATFWITTSVSEVVQGEVTFEVVNQSAATIHEMVLARVDDPATPLPYLDDLMKVDEDAAGHIAEVAELEPGEAGSLTVTLDPGDYILYCNIPGHYAMGMWTLLKVT